VCGNGLFSLPLQALSSVTLTLLILPLLHSLDNNNIGDEGAAAIAEGLMYNRTLTDLK
jgi:hypothetical protein